MEKQQEAYIWYVLKHVEDKDEKMKECITKYLDVVNSCDKGCFIPLRTVASWLGNQQFPWRTHLNVWIARHSIKKLQWQ